MRRRLLKPIGTFMREHRLATFGALLVLAFLITGIFAPFLAPQDPNKIKGILSATATVEGASTTSAATSLSPPHAVPKSATTIAEIIDGYLTASPC